MSNPTDLTRAVSRTMLLTLCLAFGAMLDRAAATETRSDSSYPITQVRPPINLPDLQVPEQTLTVIQQSGWLVVSLVDTPDELQWTVVLAKVVDGRAPVIQMDPKLPVLSVTYGPYFIRSTATRLRVFREPKGPDSGAWPVIAPVPQGKQLSRGSRLYLETADDWYWVIAAKADDKSKVDALVRLQHVKLQRGSRMASGWVGPHALGEVICGDRTRCLDEGDLLVAERVPSYAARMELTSKSVRETLIGNPAPRLTGTAIPADATVDLEQLKGHVVLIDFWATWCVPCVKNLPRINALQKKYANRGFTAIGVHSVMGADKLDAFLSKHEVSFPIVVDNGDTQKSYAVASWPTYFLIGRDGKVRSGFTSELPSEEQIERALAEEL